MEDAVGIEPSKSAFRKGPGRKIKLKMSWNKSSSVDSDNSELIDEFVQDVIQKAKQEYLSECNGFRSDHSGTNGYHRHTGRVSPAPPSPESSDEEGDVNSHRSNDRIDEEDRLNSNNCNRSVGEGIQYLEDTSHRNKAGDGIGEKCAPHERKPLIEKAGRSGHTCLQHLYALLCCQCICETYEVT
ncbi:uncharacterized protein LOC110461295 [Mizuhopecten yessoensis]|uniref:Uncharacterized protein n=1 Tax=Mizuhopecten yessoensis TaxID=6573 RepID=A0A210Q0R4_MIZYE|nr:uncharacterized protein LOC110461295 [Mizuhopecten yessoensis]OWF42259.1 hypothetical protein KP79_PYT16434 [Mizuhopecten yessoensis]